MDREYIIEKSKLDTEKLKLQFAMFLAIGIGIVSLINKDSFGFQKMDYILLNAGIIFDVIMFIFLWKTYRRINRLLKSLNKNR